MTAHALDTLAIAGKLKAAGFSDQQAEAMTFVLRDANDANFSEATTKTDLQTVRGELKSEIQAVKTELKAEIQSVRAELTSEIQS